MVGRCINGPVRATTPAAVSVEVADWSGRRGELLVIALIDMAAATWGVDVHRHGQLFGEQSVEGLVKPATRHSIPHLALHPISIISQSSSPCNCQYSL